MAKRKGVLDMLLCKQMYKMGLPDREIAHCCGVSETTVRRWRHSLGLPPNYNFDRARGPEEQLTIDAVAAKAHGLSYGQYIALKPKILLERALKKK